MSDLTCLNMAENLWPSIGREVLNYILAMTEENEYGTYKAWLEDHYQAKLNQGADAPKLSEFVRTFCRGGVQGSVKINLGATRPGVGGVNLLSNSVFSFEADGLDSLLAMLTVLSSFFEPALFVAAGDMRARQEIAKYRGDN